ncbi:MAG: ribonuclease T [Gammaproteobacteria bacterium]|nr:ribonuclease T [Gammaproteobacteria bacterium]
MQVSNAHSKDMATRFRGYLPVVVDVETAGFNSKTDALLEIAAVLVEIDKEGFLSPGRTVQCNVEPFPGANLEPEALAFNGIDPHHPFRDAKTEHDALNEIFRPVRQALKESGCNRAILVGHNAFFDLGFLNAAVERSGIKRNPFHPFSTFDTVTLCAMAFGQTVLARAAKAHGIVWDNDAAHSAIYDAGKTAELFCGVMNQWRRFQLGTS